MGSSKSKIPRPYRQTHSEIKCKWNKSQQKENNSNGHGHNIKINTVMNREALLQKLTCINHKMTHLQKQPADGSQESQQ